MHTTAPWACGLALVSLLATTSAMSQTRYRIEPIPLQPGFSNAFMRDINNNDQVVGEVRRGHPYSPTRIFIYDPHTGSFEMAHRGGLYFSAFNDLGDMVSRYLDAGGKWVRVRRDRDGTLTRMQGLGGKSADFPGAINNHRITVGSADYKNDFRAVAWGPDGHIMPLPLPADAQPKYWSSAIDINDSGLAVGYYTPLRTPPTVTERALLWQDGVYIDLWAQLGYDTSWAIGLNAAGQVVGYVKYPDSRPTEGRSVRSYIWYQGEVTFLPDCIMPDTKRKQGSFKAYQISGRGDVRGGCTRTNHRGIERVISLIYSQGAYHRLQDLLDDSGAEWQSLRLVDMNEKGSIVGDGYYKGLARIGFIATPLTP